MGLLWSLISLLECADICKLACNTPTLLSLKISNWIAWMF